MREHERDHALFAEFVKAVFAPIYDRCVREYELNGYPPAWREHIVGETYVMARLLLEEHQHRLSVAAKLRPERKNDNAE